MFKKNLIAQAINAKRQALVRDDIGRRAHIFFTQSGSDFGLVLGEPLPQINEPIALN